MCVAATEEKKIVKNDTLVRLDVVARMTGKQVQLSAVLIISRDHVVNGRLAFKPTTW